MRRLHGSIQKLGKDRWRLFATVHDRDGTARRVSKTVHGSRQDAERELARMQGTDTVANCTFSQALDDYLAHCESRVRDGSMAESTIDGYRQKIEHRMRPELGRMMCSDLTAGALNRFLDSLDKDKRGTHDVLRGALNWMFRNGYTADKLSMRMDGMKQSKPAVGPNDVYTADECAAILNYPMGDGLKTAVVLALSCGLRRGEICGLEWGDYDGESIEVKRAWGKDVPKTEASAAALTVPEWARGWLDERRGEDNEKMVPLKPDKVTYEWEKLFFRMRFKPFRKEPKEDAPTRFLPFKNLRHTNLTMVYESTGDIKLASKRGRHTTSAITERFYVRPSRSMDQKAADALDGVFGSDFTFS